MSHDSFIGAENVVQGLFEYSFLFVDDIEANYGLLEIQAAIQCLYAALDDFMTPTMEMNVLLRLSKILVTFTEMYKEAEDLLLRATTLVCDVVYCVYGGFNLVVE